MALSKSTRILILLFIDLAFFFLELITGYYTHSLALVADAFHMLNDVISLVIGLWAVKYANRQGDVPAMYTYGYQRAETIGALINGVFLIALCVSIFLEAIQRFFGDVEVGNPKLVLIVGCAGLGTNLLGLLLFHEHGHSHGGHDHGHGHDHSHAHAHGHVHNHDDQESFDVQAEEGRAAHANHKTTRTEEDYMSHKHDNVNGNQADYTSSSVPTSPSDERKQRKLSRATSNTTREIFPGPAQFRRSIIVAGLQSYESDDETEPDNTQPLIGNGHQNEYGSFLERSTTHHSHKHRNRGADANGGGGHSHHDLNMQGIFLHVMGDALGNIGVIVAALIIWLTTWEYRAIADPIISILITIIILCTAVPLCLAATRILLQAVPPGLDVHDVLHDIKRLPGVQGIHELHIWQLSDRELIASLHVKTEDATKWTSLAEEIRTCLHEFDIHNSTIQPEFANAACGCCPGEPSSGHSVVGVS